MAEKHSFAQALDYWLPAMILLHIISRAFKKPAFSLLLFWGCVTLANRGKCRTVSLATRGYV